MTYFVYILLLTLTFVYPSDHRKTIHPILGRLGIDSLIGQLTRFREDDRFRAVGPDAVVFSHHTPSFTPAPGQDTLKEDAEVWFDWAFVDFWKSNYCKTHLKQVINRRS